MFETLRCPGRIDQLDAIEMSNLQETMMEPWTVNPSSITK